MEFFSVTNFVMCILGVSFAFGQDQLKDVEMTKNLQDYIVQQRYYAGYANSITSTQSPSKLENSVFGQNYYAGYANSITSTQSPSTPETSHVTDSSPLEDNQREKPTFPSPFQPTFPPPFHIQLNNFNYDTSNKRRNNPKIQVFMDGIDIPKTNQRSGRILSTDQSAVNFVRNKDGSSSLHFGPGVDIFNQKVEKSTFPLLGNSTVAPTIPQNASAESSETPSVTIHSNPPSISHEMVDSTVAVDQTGKDPNLTTGVLIPATSLVNTSSPIFSPVPSSGQELYVFDFLAPPKTDSDMTRLLTAAVPGKTYPTFKTIPETSFTCGKSTGFFADEETGCQVFHRCDPDGRRSDYLCPEQTVYNQVTLVCDWYFNVDCNKSKKFYEYSNPRFYSKLPAFDSPSKDYVPPWLKFAN